MVARDDDFRPDSESDETREPGQDARADEQTAEPRATREDGSLGRRSTTEDAVTDPSAWSFPPDKPDPAEGPADSRASRYHTAEDPEADAAPRTTDEEDEAR
jgi:hypothetical protein